INSKAKSFRKFGSPHYAAMTRVLGDNTAKGMNAFASTQSPSQTDSSDPELKIKEEADLEDLEVDNFKAGVKERGKEIAPKAISKSRKRDSYFANLSASLNILAESRRKKVVILKNREKARAANINVSSPDNDNFLGLFSQCSSILNGMDDLDGLSYFKAMTKLKEDPTRRRIFLGMPDKRKMDRCTSLP
ncbi:Glycine--tRNA ligase beta subunit like, partial [Actinidia chinensis var. chinensis]